MDKYQKGAIGFCHSKGYVGILIRSGEWIRWRKGSAYNHAFILHEPVLDENGIIVDWTIIQAVGSGVIQDTPTRHSRLSTVAPGGNYVIVNPPSSVDGDKVIEFALAQVGEKYGFITDVSIGILILTHVALNLQISSTWICSAVAMESWRYGGFLVDWGNIYTVTPAQAFIAVHAEAAGIDGPSVQVESFPNG